MLLVNIT